MSLRFSTPIYRRRQPISYESSYLQSPREPSSILKDWQRIQSASTEAERMNDGVSQLYRTFSKVTRPQQALSPLFPFAVYQFPLALRAFIPDNYNLRFKVRGGGLLPFNFGLGGAVAGTDGSVTPDAQSYLMATTQVPPSDSTLISASWNEVVVPQDGNFYYFWLSQCLNTETSSIGIVFGNNNSTGLSMQSGNVVNDPWPTFPDNDPYHTAIAQISAEPGQPYTIEQLVRDHVPWWRTGADNVGRGMQPAFFRGEYDAGTYYFAGDEVTVTATSLGTTTRLLYLNWPSPTGSFKIANGPINGVIPTYPATDPWFLLSYSILP